MGVSIASVSKWENGQCAPELTVLMELADFFEVSMDTLVGHSQFPAKIFRRHHVVLGGFRRRGDGQKARPSYTAPFSFFFFIA